MHLCEEAGLRVWAAGGGQGWEVGAGPAKGMASRGPLATELPLCAVSVGRDVTPVTGHDLRPRTREPGCFGRGVRCP